ncbi:MAG TPA: DUF2917 domain-containing protein [Usitatibacter sp.]|nr:DUF2917 domain-containing protein [Usitatibacter sp.]
MELLVKAPVLEMSEGQVVTLVDAAGTRIAARRGTVWITEEGGRDDHILAAGEALVVGRAGRTVVQALAPSRIAIREADAAANDARC